MTHPLIEQRRDPEEKPDQQGVLVAPNGLELRVSLVVNFKPAQSTYDLQAHTHTHSQGSACSSNACPVPPVQQLELLTCLLPRSVRISPSSPWMQSGSSLPLPSSWEEPRLDMSWVS